MISDAIERPVSPGAVLTPRRMSPSAMARYAECPQAYRWHDVERRPTAPAASPALTQGNAIHHALELLLGLPSSERTPAAAEQLLRSLWGRHRRPGSFADTAQEAEFGRRAVAMVRRYAEGGAMSAQPMARESWVRVHLAEIEVFGKVDRIDRFPGGGLHVVDYKTGDRMVSEDELPELPAALVYAVATSATYRVPVRRVEFIYLASGESRTWELEAGTLREAHARLSAMVSRIASDEAYRPTPGPACSFCAFRDECPDKDRVDLAAYTADPALPF